MVFAMNRINSITPCLDIKQLRWIYPFNSRDKFNLTPNETKRSILSDISNFYEINSLNRTYQHKTKTEISTICV